MSRAYPADAGVGASTFAGHASEGVAGPPPAPFPRGDVMAFKGHAPGYSAFRPTRSVRNSTRAGVPPPRSGRSFGVGRVMKATADLPPTPGAGNMGGW